MNKPHVSCIMPTANRPNFIPLAISHFLNQTYRNAELIIVDDGTTSFENQLPDHHRIRYVYTEPLGSIGIKRNYACNLAQGDVIMHWDDDDYYAPEWISKQLDALEVSKADICGLNEITFFSPVVGKFWKYADKEGERQWLAGATMAYKKNFWLQHPFKDLQVGEDYDYIWNTGAKLFAHDYVEGFIATLHAGNTTLKPFEDRKHKKHAELNMNVQYMGKAENPEKE